MLKFGAAISLFIAISLGAATQQQILETVPYVDLSRYIGPWHEIARLDHSIQRGCVNSTAQYSFRKDGDIKVINQCNMQDMHGPMNRTIGRAWVVDQETNAKLKVQFFLKTIPINFLAGDYWIIELDQENYSYAVVGTPNRKHLWILSRTQEINQNIFNMLLEKIHNNGFDISKLLINPGTR